MPPFKSQIQKEEDIWHLVNFIRSLWPEPMRPKLVEGKASEPPHEGDDVELSELRKQKERIRNKRK
jgi:hypothetical protein